MNYLLKTVLEDKYTFIAVADVFEGMQVIKKNECISFVIVDTDNLEIEDAFNFIDLVRTNGLYQKPVIVLTSDKNSCLDEKINGLTMNELFVKPFCPSDLVRKIDSMVHTEIVNN